MVRAWTDTVMGCQSTAMTSGKAQALKYRNDPAKRVPLLGHPALFVQDNGQTCNYWKMWAAEKMEFFSAWAALQKALSASRCYWSEFEEGRFFFLSIVWYEPAEEAVCVLGRIWAWQQLGILGFYYQAKPEWPMSMCTVSAGRAACAQAPLGSDRNSVSHLPSVLRPHLVIETDSLSSYSGVLILPYDPFLFPVAFITGV